MNGLRNRLALAFIAAVAIPLAASAWIAITLVERSLSLSGARHIEDLAATLEITGRELYQEARESLRARADAGHMRPELFSAATRATWPEEVAAFAESGDAERFLVSGPKGNRLHLLRRTADGVARYTHSLGAANLHRAAQLHAEARRYLDTARNRNLRRGFLYTILLIAATVGLTTAVVLLFFANRISRPVQQLTGALQRLAGGDLSVRVPRHRDDEIGAAIRAFNDMAGQLENSRQRLILLTRLASWQALGRKMAHELKNSLTPIRLTVEEIAARCRTSADRAFFEQAAQIVIDEVTRLERRVRSFSELAAEPPVNLSALDINAVVEERLAFLRSSHPSAIYNLRLTPGRPLAHADEDLVRGVLTNLLENAADAAGSGGVILAVTRLAPTAEMQVEIHDSGPGLSLHARETLFEPTISFKKTGMGLGLSIARKSALLCGGGLESIPSELGGAAFRLTLLPAAQPPDSPPVKEPAWAQSEF